MPSIRIIAAVAALAAAITPAPAQDWPTRPVTMILPFAAGGPLDGIRSDSAARLSDVLVEIRSKTCRRRSKRPAMTKIMPEHLARSAFVYVRQSTADQLLHNHESRHRQYGLADRARQLGWRDVVVIDDDLGRSGSGVSRPGFERLFGSDLRGPLGRSSRSKLRGWHATGETGTR